MTKKQRMAAGLQDIATWHTTFLALHTAELAERGLPEGEYERALAEVARIAAVMAQRMREDYRSWSQR